MQKIKSIEKDVHILVCKYLKAKYPKVIFTSDPSGMRCSYGLRNELKAKRSNFVKIPDLIILSAQRGYHGLLIEIKRSYDEVYKKDGFIKSNERIKEQDLALEELRTRGYKAEFGFGFEGCIKIIDEYFPK